MCTVSHILHKKLTHFEDSSSSSSSSSAVSAATLKKHLRNVGTLARQQAEPPRAYKLQLQKTKHQHQMTTATITIILSVPRTTAQLCYLAIGELGTAGLYRGRKCFKHQLIALYLFKFYDFPPLNEVQQLQPCYKEFRFVFWLVDFSVRKYESFLHLWVKPLVLRKCGRRHSLILRTKTPTKATESSHALDDEWSVVVLSKLLHKASHCCSIRSTVSKDLMRMLVVFFK